MKQVYYNNTLFKDKNAPKKHRPPTSPQTVRPADRAATIKLLISHKQPSMPHGYYIANLLIAQHSTAQQGIIEKVGNDKASLHSNCRFPFKATYCNILVSLTNKLIIRTMKHVKIETFISRASCKVFHLIFVN